MSQERKFLGQGQKPQRLSNIALVVYFLRALARPFFLSRVLWRPTRQTQKKRLCSQSKCSDESSITETFIDALPDSRKEHFILQCMEIYSRHQENYHLSLHPTYLAVSLVREKNSNDIAVRAVGQGSGFFRTLLPNLLAASMFVSVFRATKTPTKPSSTQAIELEFYDSNVEPQKIQRG